MAWIWMVCSAIWSALATAPTAMGTIPRTRSGYITAHSRTRMPPIEPPSTAAQVSMPSSSASRRSASTWSRAVR
jgi:hypothetical protein